ncbi:MAG: hypothetical protein C0183_04025 [Roseiflexus castenholzii]|uniref:hypothetical protein n=1 Tax=Roseiflexus castenholzii TaxID=120962 RepID=UPI000CB61964|nr:MAG: hypothetical protein C0183_04025 [Roseiflexus castenholzii]
MERLHLERLSQRARARTTGMSRTTIAGMVHKVPTPITATGTPLRERPILERDERRLCVGHKKQSVWMWLALERPTRCVVGFALAARSADTGRRL